MASAQTILPTTGNATPTRSASARVDPPRPTRAHHACIAELTTRFPCPKDIDPSDYQARANLLARDCADLSPALLRRACDRAARDARFLPYASEIRQAAADILHERQRTLARGESAAEGRDTDAGFAVAAWVRQQNLNAAAAGMKIRLVVNGGRAEVVDYLLPRYEVDPATGLKRMAGYRRNSEVRQLADGTCEQAFWSEQRGEMIWPDGLSVTAAEAREAMTDWAAE